MHMPVVWGVWQNMLGQQVLPDDDKQYAVETCRNSESVLM